MVRKVAEIDGVNTLSTIQFTSKPRKEEVEFPEGYRVYVKVDGEIREIDPQTFFKRQDSSSGLASPFIETPDGAGAFISTAPIAAQEKIEVYLSDNFFTTPERNFWYNFHFTHQNFDVGDELASENNRQEFSRVQEIIVSSQESQDFSETFADVMNGENLPENKEVLWQESATGEITIDVPEDRTLASFGMEIDSLMVGDLSKLWITLHYVDGSEAAMTTQDFFLIPEIAEQEDHANVFFQNVKKEDIDRTEKQHLSINIPLVGVRRIALTSNGETIPFSTKVVRIKTDVLPIELQENKFAIRKKHYITEGGGDDVQLTPEGMNTVCNVLRYFGARERGWPYFFLEQGPVYYRPEIDEESGLAQFVISGQWSGGEDPFASFYEGYHPLNGGVLGMKEEEGENGAKKNTATMWLGISSDQNGQGFIPDLGADHHALEMNYSIDGNANWRYFLTHVEAYSMGYAGGQSEPKGEQDYFNGRHYLQEEMETNKRILDKKSQIGEEMSVYQQKYADTLKQIKNFEDILIDKRSLGDALPIEIPSLWRSIQAGLEYLRYIKNTPNEQNTKIADLARRNLIANLLLVTAGRFVDIDPTTKEDNIHKIFEKESELDVIDAILGLIIQYSPG